MTKNYMFRKTYENLLKRLDYIRKKRILLIEELQKAAEHGDLRENGEFDSAMEIQGQLNREADLILSRLNNVEFIENLKISLDRVSIGTVVTLFDIENKEKILKFSIIGCTEDEVPATTIKLTYNSPLARKLIGKSVGDIVFGIGSEKVNAEVVKIERLTDFIKKAS